MYQLVSVCWYNINTYIETDNENLRQAEMFKQTQIKKYNVMNYGFLTTETNSKALNIFRGFL